MKKKTFPQLHSIRSKLLPPYPMNITPKVWGTLPPNLAIDITPTLGVSLSTGFEILFLNIVPEYDRRS